MFNLKRKEGTVTLDLIFGVVGAVNVLLHLKKLEKFQKTNWCSFMPEQPKYNELST